jgi:gag-polypeptide of LTR copia-type
MGISNEDVLDERDLPEEEWDAKMKKLDIRAWNFIALAVETCQHIHVKNSKGGRESWNRLKDFHVQTTLSARIRVLKRLFRVSLKEGESMEEHLQYVFEKFSELNEIGYGLENEMAVSILLASLTHEYDPLITALEAWDESRLTLQAVRSKLLEEWRRKKSVKENDTTESALRVFDRLGKDNRPICRACKKRGHIEKNCWNKEKMESNQGSNENANYARVAFSARVRRAPQWKINKRVCFECGKRDHTIAGCPQKPNMKSEVVRMENELNLENKAGSAKMARFSQMYSFVSLPKREFQGWIIDSGASNHMCSDKSLFSSLKYGSFGEVIVANGQKVLAKAKGSINLVIKNGTGTIEIHQQIENLLDQSGFLSSNVMIREKSLIIKPVS